MSLGANWSKEWAGCAAAREKEDRLTPATPVQVFEASVGIRREEPYVVGRGIGPDSLGFLTRYCSG